MKTALIVAALLLSGCWNAAKPQVFTPPVYDSRELWGR